MDSHSGHYNGKPMLRPGGSMLNANVKGACRSQR